MIINTKNLSRARARSSIESTTRVDTLTKRWISFRLEYSKIEYVFFWENTRFDSFSTRLTLIHRLNESLNNSIQL